jgi:hypothetical protein
MVETDASESGISDVLMQEGHPIVFISKSLRPRQQALSTYEKEMLAILHVVTKWRHYKWGRHFTIITDHVSLKYLLAQKVSFPSQHIWLAKLLGFDYEIEYRKGKQNIIVDALSRCTSSEVFTLILSTISTNLLEEVKAFWATNNALLKIISNLNTDPSLHLHYTWLNGLLYRKGKLVVGNDSNLQGKLISIYHDSAIGG